MAAPNSAQTRPSQKATTAPNNHPTIACGPCALLSRSGIVMNGPTPIISSMLADVASRRPMPRIRWGARWRGKSIGYDTGALRTLLVLLAIVCLLRAQTELGEAAALARAGRFAEARAKLAGVTEPQDTRQRIAFHRLRAAIASGLNQTSTAVEEMKAALQLAPSDPLLLVAPAMAETQAGQLEDAIP